jgi:hypothetical protein
MLKTLAGALFLLGLSLEPVQAGGVVTHGWPTPHQPCHGNHCAVPVCESDKTLTDECQTANELYLWWSMLQHGHDAAEITPAPTGDTDPPGCNNSASGALLALISLGRLAIRPLRGRARPKNQPIDR